MDGDEYKVARDSTAAIANGNTPVDVDDGIDSGSSTERDISSSSPAAPEYNLRTLKRTAAMVNIMHNDPTGCMRVNKKPRSVGMRSYI